MNNFLVYVDGASRGNPGEASIGVSIQNEKGEEVGSISKKIGQATNNIAEYSALIEALSYVHEKSIRAVKVFADSELMVRQIKGEYRVKNPELKIRWEKAKKLIEKLELFSIQHVPREKNKRADELANLALDS